MSKILAGCQRLLLNVGRYFETVRYLRPRQLVWRACLRIRRQVCLKSARVKRRLQAMALAHAQELTRREPGPFLRSVGWNEFTVEHHIRVARRAVELEFEFLNEAKRFSGQIDWNPHGYSQLWKYNLHYHSYLVSLGIAYRLTSDLVFFDTFKAIVEDWIAANPMPCGVAWDPYPVSLRIVNWLFALQFFADRLDQVPDFAEAVRVSLVEQVDYVMSNLELDLGGNHLLANLKALCLAGLYFAGPSAERWLRRGSVLLEREMERQILADGGHYERSPMYHSIVFEDLLTVAAAFENARHTWPRGLRDKLNSMARFLKEITHPDGDIALFNDSAFEIAQKPGQLLYVADLLVGTDRCGAAPFDAKYALLVPPRPISAQAKRMLEHTSKFTQFPETGYYVVSHNDQKLLVDVGPVGPDDLPGHAHADIFTYELSIAGRRWVVDSGVREYVAGAWRDYARSTRAHNTVSVNGQNQVDVWGSFRVGKRVKPTSVYSTCENETTIICGKHLGFGRLRPHVRILIDLKGETWVVIDEVSGAGPATVENFIHFHPDVHVDLHGNSAVLSQKGLTVRLLTAGFDKVECLAGHHDPLNGWYMPRFGVAQPSPTLVGTTTRPASLTCYILSLWKDLRIKQLEREGAMRRCILCKAGEEIEIVWDIATLKPRVTRRTV